MPALPSDIPVGYVDAAYIRVVADTTNDADAFPDSVYGAGTVTFTPLTRKILSDDPRWTGVVVEAVSCTLDSNGLLRDSAGNRGVWLVANIGWTATVSITGEVLTIYPVASNTTSAPLDLNAVSPLVPTPVQKFVVNEQVYTDTLAAAADAKASAKAAALSATQAGNGGTGAPTGGGDLGVNVPFTNASSLTYTHSFGRLPTVQFRDAAGAPFWTDSTATSTVVTAVFPEPTTGLMVLS